MAALTLSLPILFMAGASAPFIRMVGVGAMGVTQRFCICHECLVVRQELVGLITGNSDWPSIAVVRSITEIKVALEAVEIGKHVRPSPARPSRFCPAVVVFGNPRKAMVVLTALEPPTTLPLEAPHFGFRWVRSLDPSRGPSGHSGANSPVQMASCQRFGNRVLLRLIKPTGPHSRSIG